MCTFALFVFQEGEQREEDREKPKQGIDLGAHLRTACSSGRRLDAYKTPFPLATRSQGVSLNTHEGIAEPPRVSSPGDDENFVCFSIWANLR